MQQQGSGQRTARVRRQQGSAAAGGRTAGGEGARRPPGSAAAAATAAHVSLGKTTVTGSGGLSYVHQVDGEVFQSWWQVLASQSSRWPSPARAGRAQPRASTARTHCTHPGAETPSQTPMPPCKAALSRPHRCVFTQGVSSAMQTCNLAKEPGCGHASRAQAGGGRRRAPSARHKRNGSDIGKNRMAGSEGRAGKSMPDNA